MPGFTKDAFRTPFGHNVYKRSTSGMKFKSFTLARSTIPITVIDGTNTQTLQPGTAMASITSGVDIGKIGPFQPGVTDGRQLTTGLVGLAETRLPWQLLDRDVEIAVLYTGVAVQAWCFELNAGGVAIALTNTVADAMRSTKTMDILFS
jgi:hypothetical protein